MDLIVCYDATSSPTRSIQRMGRTGRHKEGRVVYILSAGREEEKYRQIEDVRRWVWVCCGWVVAGEGAMVVVPVVVVVCVCVCWGGGGWG